VVVGLISRSETWDSAEAWLGLRGDLGWGPNFQQEALFSQAPAGLCLHIGPPSPFTPAHD
jgi:hypothetical protein